MAALAILCSGQGRQSTDMFAKLRNYPEALELEKQIKEAAIIPDACFSDSTMLFDNKFAQPLICLYQAMLWRIISPLLPEVSLFAGYSLGELTAFHCSAMLDAFELIRLAVIRGQIMSNAAKSPQAMLAVLGLNAAEIAESAEKYNAHLAIRNAAHHLIYGLETKNLNAFEQELLAAGATRTVILPVSVAAHTPFLNKAAQEFEQILRKIPAKYAEAPVLSSVNSEKIYNSAIMPDALSSQINSCVDWQTVMESALASPCKVFLELGPGKSLVNIIREEYPQVEARSLDEFQDIKAAAIWTEKAINRLY